MPIIPPAGVALPVIKTLADCADYSKTVEPFIDQLYGLPQQLISSASSTSALKELYISTNPLVSGFAISLFLSVIFFVVSEANKNYSQVDRCWSLLPTFYNAHFWLWAKLNDLQSQRLDALLAVSVIWSTRLTYNYWRKGGYEVGSEDYRWAIIKKRVATPLWIIFNITFISTIQSILLFSVTTPTYILLLTTRVQGPQLTGTDRILALLVFGIIAVEYVADEQQWRYQSAKTSYREKAKVPAGYTQRSLDLGFNTEGLWKYSRHPNFAAEQAVWLAFYQWACVETLVPYNWTIAGTLSYLALFQGSTWLTERITAGKYPEYAAYQERVGRFVPKLLGEGWDGYSNSPAKAEGKKTK